MTLHYCEEESGHYMAMCQETEKRMLLEFAQFKDDMHYFDGCVFVVKYCPFCGYHKDESSLKEGLQ